MRELPIDQISDFPNHPYKVKDDQDMMNLVESIRKNGVLTPVTVRKIPGGRFEMISGHRRKRACEFIGLRTIRGEVLNVDDNVAAIMMCDSNLHRSVILPSEKAFAYKMRLEAMKCKSGRPSRNVSPAETLRSDVQLSHEIGESRNQIHRYIRLTKLIPEILTMVDEGRIALRTAVKISYFPGDLQGILFACMDKDNSALSHSQAASMRELLKQGKLTARLIKTMMHAGKPVRKKKIAFKDERMDELIPEGG
ncbi:MAG: ParB/RepB/Spo0J family partition protein [Anaerovoracaceae bacterium]